jgi:hypothetical protein
MIRVFKSSRIREEFASFSEYLRHSEKHNHETFSLVERSVRTLLAFDVLILCQRKAIPRL